MSREDYRIIYLKTVAAKKIYDEELVKIRPDIFEVDIINISATGVNFTTLYRLELGDQIMIKIPIDDTTYIIEMKCQIVRSDKERIRYSCGAKFLDMTQDLEAQIRKFIYQLQIKKVKAKDEEDD